MRGQMKPECQWVPVVDGSGRRHLEMRWAPRYDDAVPLPVRAAAASSARAA